jgi:hypothetical protein
VIPLDVRRFILTSIPSVPHLEAILFYFRAPDAERSCADAARALYLPEPVTAASVADLAAAGILTARDAAEGRLYRFSPQDDGLASAISELAAAYATDMIEVTHLIHDSTQKSAHRFADAFKLRKDN